MPMFWGHKDGVPTAKVCGTQGRGPAKFYKFKSTFGGLDLSEALRPETFLAADRRGAFGGR